MTKLVIHAGLHKTGTSAIQKALCSNRDHLWNNGLFYPETRPFEAHHRFASRLYEGRSMKTRIEDAMRTTLTYKRKAAGRDVVLSSEMLSVQFDPHCFRELHSLFDQIEICFYVRQQDELFESAYNQQVKCKREYRAIEECPPYFANLHQRISKFQNAVVGSRVFALEYKKKLFIDGNIVSDFFHRVLGLSPQDKSFGSRNIVNPSLSPVACAILSRVNRLSLPEEQWVDARDNLISEYPCAKFKQYSLMSVEHRMRIRQRSEESNRKLVDEYLESGTLAFEDHSDKVYIDSRLLGDFLRSSISIRRLSQRRNGDLDDLLSQLSRSEFCPSAKCA